MRLIRLLPIAFVFTGLMTMMERGWNDEVSRLALLRSNFTAAVGEARGRVSAVAWTVLNDPQIEQNFNLGNINTVSQSLQSYIRPGEISQIDVLDADCQLLARVPQSGKTINDLCKVIKSGKPAIFWQISDQEEPVFVTLASRQLGGQTVFVAAQLVFDQAWISLFPSLSRRVADREMAFGLGSRGSLLWREGLTADGRYALPLYADGWMYRLIPNLTSVALESQKDSFWLLYGALGLCICLAMLQVSARERRDGMRRESLQAWIVEQQTRKSSAGSNLNQKPQSWDELINLTKSVIMTKDEQRALQARLLQERVESVTNRLRERDMEFSVLETKILSMSDLASLQEQLQRTSASFLRQMNHMRDLCETIYDMASSGLSQQAKSLNDLYTRWKEGLNQGANREIAARKFFRSLVETKGKTPGVSKLDEDMRELSALAAATLDQSLHTAMLARQVTDDCEAAAKMAAFWNGIATRDRNEKTSDWASCLVSAQRLVSADDKYQSLTFETLPNVGHTDELYPAVSHGVLVSGLFHLYLALLTSVDTKTVSLPLVIRQKRLKEQATIILSLPSRHASQNADGPTRDMLYHVDLAKQLLSSYGIKVSILPATIAGYPVGITWSLPQKELMIVSESNVQVTLAAD